MDKKLPLYIGEISAPSRKKDFVYKTSEVKKLVEIIEKSNRLAEEIEKKENETHRK